jgi:hypothetical protein
MRDSASEFRIHSQNDLADLLLGIQHRVGGATSARGNLAQTSSRIRPSSSSGQTCCTRARAI